MDRPLCGSAITLQMPVVRAPSMSKHHGGPSAPRSPTTRGSQLLPATLASAASAETEGKQSVGLAASAPLQVAVQLRASTASAAGPADSKPSVSSHVASHEDQAFFDLPQIKAQLARMREMGSEALKNARTKESRKQLERYYSEKFLKKRVALLANQDVANALEMVWSAADQDGSQAIDRHEYVSMHRKLVLALDPTTTPKVAFASGREDWLRDAEGQKELNKDRFFRCWFEIADLNTKSTVDASVYAQFLTSTINTLVKRDANGMVGWVSDREVLQNHFTLKEREAEREKQRERAKEEQERKEAAEQEKEAAAPQEDTGQVKEEKSNEQKDKDKEIIKNMQEQERTESERMAKSRLEKKKEAADLRLREYVFRLWEAELKRDEQARETWAKFEQDAVAAQAAALQRPATAPSLGGCGMHEGDDQASSPPAAATASPGQMHKTEARQQELARRRVIKLEAMRVEDLLARGVREDPEVAKRAQERRKAHEEKLKQLLMPRGASAGSRELGGGPFAPRPSITRPNSPTREHAPSLRPSTASGRGRLEDGALIYVQVQAGQMLLASPAHSDPSHGVNGVRLHHLQRATSAHGRLGRAATRPRSSTGGWKAKSSPETPSRGESPVATKAARGETAADDSRHAGSSVEQDGGSWIGASAGVCAAGSPRPLGTALKPHDDMHEDRAFRPTSPESATCADDRVRFARADLRPSRSFVELLELGRKYCAEHVEPPSLSVTLKGAAMGVLTPPGTPSPRTSRGWRARSPPSPRPGSALRPCSASGRKKTSAHADAPAPVWQLTADI